MSNKIGYLVSLSVMGNYGGGFYHTMVPMVENPVKWYSDWREEYNKDMDNSEKSYAGRTVQYYDVCILNVIETNATSTSFLKLLGEDG